MGSKKVYYLVAIFVAVGLSIILADPAFAAESDVQQVENFIRSIIRVIAGFAGLVATGFLFSAGSHILPVLEIPSISTERRKLYYGRRLDLVSLLQRSSSVRPQ